MNSPFTNKTLSKTSNPKRDFESLQKSIPPPKKSPENILINTINTNSQKTLSNNIIISNITNSNPTLNINNILSNSNSNSTNNIISLRPENFPEKKNETLKTITEETKQYVEELKKGTYNILVAVRCRPLSLKEKEISIYETIQIMDRKIIILKDPNSNLNPNNSRTKEQHLAFDYAFDKYEKQENIFINTTKFLVEGVVNGYNATVFAYGATGAGKTYTMLGNDENPGIMSLTLKDLFNKIKKYCEREYTVKLWYLEIYNENIRDLLVNNSENLELREDPNKGLIVNNITEMIPKNSEHILNILKKGNKNRTTEATNANETSSRSHAILQIMVSYKEKASGINYEIKYGKLSLIDLAGSERASVTKNKGVRLFEGANINKSLLTLGNCINALCEANEKGTKNYVPYRDSKLTRLLKDSLGGNSRTVMIANVSPFIYSFDDTYNTLKYADRAKHIKTNLKRNVLNAQYHITNYLNVIKNLQNRVFELESQINIKKKDLMVSPIKIKNSESCDNKISNRNNLDSIHMIKENEDEISSNENVVSNNQYETDINNFILNLQNEVKIKEKSMNLQLQTFLIYNSIKKNEFYGMNVNELKNKAKNIKKILESSIQILNECSQKNDKEYKILNESSELNTMQKNYINASYENTKTKIENLEIKFKLSIMKNSSDNKSQYIKELEEQIELRDEVINKNNLIYAKEDPEKFFDVLTTDQISRYKELSQLQKINSANKKNNKDNNTIMSNNNLDYFYNKRLKKKLNKKFNLNINANNSFSKLNTPLLKNSSSTQDVLPLRPELTEFSKFPHNNDRENEIEMHKIYLPPLSLKNNNKLQNDDEANNKTLKSMLNDIQAMNSDISLKLNIIEQNSNKIKKNSVESRNNVVNTTLNNINLSHLNIPNNSTFNFKNYNYNALNNNKKENEKNLPKNKNLRINSGIKRMNNVPSAGNILNTNSNISTLNNNKAKSNYCNTNKNFLVNSVWNTKNMPIIESKHRKEGRTRSSLSRNVPWSAKSNYKSSENSKSKKKENKKSPNIVNNTNNSKEKSLRNDENNLVKSKDNNSGNNSMIIGENNNINICNKNIFPKITDIKSKINNRKNIYTSVDKGNNKKTNSNLSTNCNVVKPISESTDKKNLNTLNFYGIHQKSYKFKPKEKEKEKNYNTNNITNQLSSIQPSIKQKCKISI